MNFKIGEVSITINLEKKVYVEIMGSGVGKTYLHKLLSSQSEKKELYNL